MRQESSIVDLDSSRIRYCIQRQLNYQLSKLHQMLSTSANAYRTSYVTRVTMKRMALGRDLRKMNFSVRLSIQEVEEILTSKK